MVGKGREQWGQGEEGGDKEETTGTKGRWWGPAEDAGDQEQMMGTREMVGTKRVQQGSGGGNGDQEEVTETRAERLGSRRRWWGRREDNKDQEGMMGTRRR